MGKAINILTVLLVCFMFHQGAAQKLTEEAVRQDLRFLQERILQYNPALPFYHPEFQVKANEVISEVKQDSISVFDYYSLVSKLCTLAHEGHFSIGESGDLVRQKIMDNIQSYLPILVEIFNKQVYITHDFSNERLLQRGDRLVTINGQPIEEILDELIQVTPSDGEISTYALRKIAAAFSWQYLIHIEQPESFSIAYINAAGVEQTAKINALTRENQVTNFRKYFADEVSDRKELNRGFYGLEYHSEYALLTLPSFDFRRIDKYGVKANKLYRDIFEEIDQNQTKNLIIDLRGNTGGRNEFADDMIPYIMKMESADPYFKQTISWEGKERNYKLPSVSRYAFTGKIYVLVNGTTYSAGNSLARYLKEYGDALIIGEETGTRYEGFAAGSKQEVRLPNSQLLIGIPRYHILYPKSKKQNTVNRGLMPDFEILESFEAFEKEQDLHLEKALSLINKSG